MMLKKTESHSGYFRVAFFVGKEVLRNGENDTQAEAFL